MGLRKYRLKNKPICIYMHAGSVYIGDAGGCITSCPYPFAVPVPFLQSTKPSPISSICSDGRLVFYANWDGEVAAAGMDGSIVCTKKIECGIVKCCRSFGTRIFLSVNLRVYALDAHLNILNVYEMQSKVLCMEMLGQDIYFGMSVPYVSVLGGSSWMTRHATSILCMRASGGRLLTSSADSTIRGIDGTCVYEGENWIRSLGSGVFSEGRHVRRLGGKFESMYSHDADVSGVETYKECVLSVGFDCSFCVYDTETAVFSDEEREIQQLLAETGGSTQGDQKFARE